MEVQTITLKINGTDYEFSVGNLFGQIPARETLSQTLRNRLGLTGSKESCDEGACGCCTVIMIEYKWRTFNNFPEVDTSILQSQFDTYQFKAVGVGEIAGAAAASATMAAISNAIGIQVAQYPATPDVILKALGKIQ